MFCFSFRALLCYLRHRSKKDCPKNTLLSGFIASIISLPFCTKETRVTLALYLFARSMESVAYIGVERKYFPAVPHFSVLLFVVMVTFMVYTLFYHFDTFAKGTEKSLFRLAKLTKNERNILGFVRSIK